MHRKKWEVGSAVPVAKWAIVVERVMPKNKSKSVSYVPVPFTAGQRIDRWNACQAIGRVYFLSELTREQLVELFQSLKEQYSRKNLTWTK